jgi:D-sedoheptulose 7-phosphate isomerase
LRKLIETYLEEFAEGKNDVKVSDIKKVAVILNDAWVYGKQVFICGNGGSASTASHFASDLAKIGLRAFCLNDNISRVTAITNDSGWDKLYVEQLESLFRIGDILVAFSVHGGVGKDKADAWSQNLLQAIEYANTHGGTTVGIVGFEGGIMRKVCDVSVKVNVHSTPIVESWHLGIAHLLCECLKETEVKPVKSCRKCGRIQPFGNKVCIECGNDSFYIVAGILGNIEDLKRGIE